MSFISHNPKAKTKEKRAINKITRTIISKQHNRKNKKTKKKRKKQQKNIEKNEKI